MPPLSLTSITSLVPRPVLTALQNIVSAVNTLQGESEARQGAHDARIAEIGQLRSELQSLTALVNNINRRVTDLETP